MYCACVVLSVNFSRTHYSVVEDVGAVTVCLQLNDVAVATGADIWVALTTDNGSLANGNKVVQIYGNFIKLVYFTDGQDFFSSSIFPDLFFPAGSEEGAQLCTNITIVDDNVFEQDHSFTVHIDSTEDNVLIAEPRFTTINITDNEGINELLV